MLPASLGVLVLPAALLSFLLIFLRGNRFRDAAMRALLLFGAVVTLLTEALGAMALLRRGPLLLSWSLSILLAALVHRFRIPALRIPRGGLLDFAAVAGIAAIAVLVGCTAWLSPPNSADALTYHLPRVVYWAQAGSVAFFPTPFYNQIMLPPLAEYMVLHTYVLSGGDHYANFVQFLAFAGSVLGTSLIAQALGAASRGQLIAALFTATIPNGILQASGAKNDYLLAFWLVAMVYFALRFSQSFDRSDLAAMGISLALALLTKGTGYLFAPALLFGAFLPVAGREWRRLLRAAPVVVLCIVALNGPQYGRNFFFSGSILGYDSAQGDGLFRWRNERLGVRSTLSNLLRNTAAHLGARSPTWNQGVYDMVARAHRFLGVDPNDPDTTWRWERFRAPVNSNHEADAPNRWQLLLLVAAAFPLGWLAWRGEKMLWLSYYVGLLLAFFLFCLYLKWMPWITRLHLPVFVLGSPLVGALAEKLLPAPLQAVLCLFLLNNARPYVFENWTRPLKGPASLWRTARDDNYFSDYHLSERRKAYKRAVALTSQSGCTNVGIDISLFQLEYPFQALLREVNPQVRFTHVGVNNASSRYQTRPPPRPCAALCLDCAGHQEKINLYRPVGEPITLDGFLLFLAK